MLVGCLLNNKSQLQNKKRNAVYNALFGLHPHVLSPNWWAVSATGSEGAKISLEPALVRSALRCVHNQIQYRHENAPFPLHFQPVVQLSRESTHRAADFPRRHVQWLVTTAHVFSKLRNNMQHSASCYIIYVRCSTHPLHNRPLLHRHHAALTTFIAQAWCERSL